MARAGLFPDTDSGQFILHVRARTGTRIEETARLFDLVEDVIRQNIPAKEMDNILDNIGLPYSPYNTMHLTSVVLGANDGDVLVSFRNNHHPVADYVRDLRALLPQRFPGATFYFLPADIVTQILDFGLPSPIDVQVEGNDVVASQQIAEKLMAQMRQDHPLQRGLHRGADLCTNERLSETMVFRYRRPR